MKKQKQKLLYKTKIKYYSFMKKPITKLTKQYNLFNSNNNKKKRQKY